MDNKNDSSTIKVIGLVVAILILVLPLVIVSAIGHAWYSDKLDRCYEYVVVPVSESGSKSYLYAPYHGGRVETHYEYYTIYATIIDGKRYWVTAKSYSPLDKNSFVLFRYNPDNYEENFFDMSAIGGQDLVDPYCTVFVFSEDTLEGKIYNLMY